jgi:hypothetical protein
MRLSDVFLQLGEDHLRELVRGISIGKLRTFQLYDRFKTRTHLAKVNTQTLKNAVPKFWQRLEQHDEAFATDLAQAVLIAHMDMIAAVLNFLGIPNQEGFFEKDLDASPYLTEGWEQRALSHFRGSFPESLLLFYINHLAWEMGGAKQAFLPAA